MNITPSNFQFETVTGYQLSFHEFRRLISEPETQPGMAAMLKEWFQYELCGLKDAATVRSEQEGNVDLAAVHRLIQSDSARQYRLYQFAMSYWR